MRAVGKREGLHAAGTAEVGDVSHNPLRDVLPGQIAPGGLDIHCNFADVLDFLTPKLARLDRERAVVRLGAVLVDLVELNDGFLHEGPEIRPERSSRRPERRVTPSLS